MKSMKTRYLSAVNGLLDCPVKERKRLLRQLDSAVSTYLADEPDGGEEGLTANFGTPEDCAARLLEECEPAALVLAWRRKDVLRRALLGVMAVLIVVTLGVVAYLWSNGGIGIITIRDLEPGEWEARPSEYAIYKYDDID